MGLLGKVSDRRSVDGGRLPIFAVIVVFLVLLLPGLMPNVIAPHSPVQGNLVNRLSPPVFAGGTWEFPLGTDQLGRDIFSRIIHGARVSLTVALTGIAFAGAIGTVLGMIAGLLGGAIDTVIMRIVEMTFSIPLILLGLVFATTVGPSFGSVLFVVAVVLWAYYARQIRGEVAALRNAAFIDRAKVAGSSTTRILLKHVFPNITNTLIVLVTLQVAVVIVMESTLSFLGVGLPRPLPSWGLMVADGRILIIEAWWISFFPGLAITLTVVALNVFGDWIRDRLDPKLKQI
jgi:peptide/nickel transport system permease protein